MSELKLKLQKSENDTSRVLLLLEICTEIKNADEKLYYSRKAKRLSLEIDYSKGHSISLFEEGKALLLKNDIPSSLKTLHQSYQLFKARKNLEFQAENSLFLGECYQKSNLNDSAFYFFSHAKILALENEHRAIEAEANYFLGNLSNSIGQNNRAIKYLTESLRYYREVDSKDNLWYVLNSLGVVYDDLANYPEALKCYLEALEITNDIVDIGGQVMVLNNLASFYYQVNKLDQAIRYYDKALDLMIALNDPEDEWILLNNKAQIYIEMGDTLNAGMHLKKAYEIVSKLGDNCETVFVLDGIALVLKGQGKLDSARNCYLRAISFAQECNNPLLLTMLFRGIGEVYYEEGNFNSAENYYYSSLDLCRKSGFAREEEKVYFQMYKLYKSKNRISKALKYFELYSLTKDSLFNTEANTEVAKLSAEYEFKKELHRMEFTKRAEELKLMGQIDREASNKNVLLLVLILTVLLAAALVRSYFLLQNHNKRLESLNEEKNTLMGVVAHDLRSPLNNINGLLSLMKSDKDYKDLSTENKDYYRLLSESTTRMRDMIDRVLDINAIEEMKLNLNMQRYDMGKILNNVCENYKLLAAKKNIQINHDLKEQRYYVNVDKNYVIQVFDNLMSNAIKYSEENKNIYMKIEETEQEVVVISVIDEGLGLSEDDRSNLFTKFKKLASKPTGNEDSIGLGLSIVKKFVDAMQGEITCQSELGKGSTFQVRFQTS
ncbi:MAG: tetratricopeptide repeat-containing sensor histidine kinase [Reichenbachiella sp.]